MVKKNMRWEEIICFFVLSLKCFAFPQETQEHKSFSPERKSFLRGNTKVLQVNEKFLGGTRRVESLESVPSCLQKGLIQFNSSANNLLIRYPDINCSRSVSNLTVI